MPKTLQHPPFPDLAWDGFTWRTPVQVPWYPPVKGKGPRPVRPELLVRIPASQLTEGMRFEAAPRPTAAQGTAWEQFLDPARSLKDALLAAMQENVPELAEAAWEDVLPFFGLSRVSLFATELESLSYIGLELFCLQWEFGYEHGVGIVAHGGRVVRFGMGDDGSDEQFAMKDLRRKTKKP